MQHTQSSIRMSNQHLSLRLMPSEHITEHSFPCRPLDEAEQLIRTTMRSIKASPIPACRRNIRVRWRREIIAAAVTKYIVPAIWIADADNNSVSAGGDCQTSPGGLDDCPEVGVAVEDVAIGANSV